MLPNITIFQGLGEPQRKLLAAITERYVSAEGQSVFAQGDPATHLYLILSGSVALQFKPHDGPPLTVTRLRAGDAFGWSAVIGAPAYTSGVLVMRSLEALRISGKALRRLCAAQPDLGRMLLSRLARSVASRWKNADQQASAILAAAVASIAEPG
jgi:CRP-like cAMP-binding protein